MPRELGMLEGLPHAGCIGFAGDFRCERVVLSWRSSLRHDRRSIGDVFRPTDGDSIDRLALFVADICIDQ
jgi:hypothetical protein